MNNFDKRQKLKKRFGHYFDLYVPTGSPIKCQYSSYSKQTKLDLIRKIRFRLFYNASLQNFKERINNTSFDDACNLKDSNEPFNDRLFQVYNETFPFKTKNNFINNINTP